MLGEQSDLGMPLEPISLASRLYEMRGASILHAANCTLWTFERRWPQQGACFWKMRKGTFRWLCWPRCGNYNRQHMLRRHARSVLMQMFSQVSVVVAQGSRAHCQRSKKLRVLCKGSSELVECSLYVHEVELHCLAYPLLTGSRFEGVQELCT